MNEINYDALIYAFFLIFMLGGCVIGLSTNAVSIRTVYKKPTFFMYILLIFLIMNLGTSTGTDRMTYARIFEHYVDWGMIEGSYIGWSAINYILSRFISTPDIFFIVISCIYVITNFWFCRTISINYHILFIMVISCLGFRSYGVNTIKAGVGLSFALLAFAHYFKNWKKGAIFSVISILIHTSCVIPVLAFWLIGYFKKIKLNWLYALWIICVVLSILAGDFFKVFLGQYLEEVELESSSYFLTTESDYNMGFRYDFLLYSFVPILWGWFLINTRRYEEETWMHLYKTYIMVNSFWVLVITMNFTDRVAYLSWFLIPYVTLLPLLDNNYNIKNRNKYIQYIMLVFGIFNIYMVLR